MMFAGAALIGKRFGNLVAVAVAPNQRGDRALLCQCDCGKTTIVRTRALTSGNTKSCGCLRKSKVVRLNWKHGLAPLKQHPLYAAWTGIKARCFNQRTKAFKNYGGRGISIWQKWRDDPVAFVEWCLSNGWQPHLTIDRFPDANGDYAPDNIRFVTKSENSRFKHWWHRRDRVGLLLESALSLPA